MSKVVTIREEIRHAIRKGELLPGDRLPIQEEIADKYSTGVSTVHAALKPLKALGLIYTAHDGTFIGPRVTDEAPPVEDATARVSCSVRGCNNSFEINNWNRVMNVSRLLKRVGWTRKGSKESTLFFCHRCSANRK